MSTYTAHQKNKSQVELQETNIIRCKDELIKWLSDKFDEQDHLVTLTFKPGLKLDELARSTDIKHFLNRLNRKVFGRAFDKGQIRLRCCPIFEVNRSGDLHVHMLLSAPNDTSKLTSQFKWVVRDTWLTMKNAGVNVAQDVRACWDVCRLLGYLTKQITTSDKLLRVDLNNTYWPTQS